MLIVCECDSMCGVLFQSPDGTAAAVMPPPPYYVAGSHCNVIPQYPDDLDDDDTDWDRLL